METEELQLKFQCGDRRGAHRDRRVSVEVAEWRQKSCSGSCRVETEELHIETEELQWKMQSGDRCVHIGAQYIVELVFPVGIRVGGFPCLCPR